METTRFKVPEGTEFIEQSLVDGCLVTKFIPKVDEFRDLDCIKFQSITGEIAYAIINDNFDSLVIIPHNSVKVSTEKVDLAPFKSCAFKITRQEMQAELAKHGKYFDFDEKVLKNVRWRAEKGEAYYTMESDFEPSGMHDDRDAIDNMKFKIGNYFKTEKECQEFCNKVKALIK